LAAGPATTGRLETAGPKAWLAALHEK
jgi:hypothetical protein